MGYTYEIVGTNPVIYQEGREYLTTTQEFGSAAEAETWAQERIAALQAAVPALTERKPVLSKGQFRSRFSFTERVAITDAAKTDTGVKVILDDLFVVDEVDPDDPAVAASLEYLVGLGLLTAERKQQILS